MQAVGYRRSSAVRPILIALVLVAAIIAAGVTLLLSSVAHAPAGAARSTVTVPAGFSGTQGLNDQDALGPIYPPGSFSEFAAPQGPNDQDALGQI